MEAFGPQATEPLYEPTQSPFWIKSGPLEDELCKANELHFSYDGKWLLFSAGSGARKSAQVPGSWPSVGLVSSDCIYGIADVRACRAFTITSMSDVSHIWLSRSGAQAFVLDAGGRRVSKWPISGSAGLLGGDTIEYAIVQHADERGINFPYDSYSPRTPVVQVWGYSPYESLPQEAARLSEAVVAARKAEVAPVILETVALDQHGIVGAAYLEPADLSLRTWSPSRPGFRLTGLRRPYWDQVILARGISGAAVESFPVLVGTGAPSRAGYWRQPSKIIRSNRSGAAIGAFGETVFQGGRLRGLAPRFGEGRRSLWSYAVDEERRRAVAVVLAPFGAGELQILTKTGSRRITCLQPAEHRPVYRSLLTLGEGQSSLPARLYQGVRRSEKLIVWMHGGPDNTIAYEYGLDQVTELVGLGYDVLVPEYRGTRGNDPRLAADLRLSGRAAIRGDIERIGQWVRESRYRSATLYGISFGGLYSWLWSGTDPFDRHVLVAPLLKWRGAELVSRRPGDHDWPGRHKFLTTSIENVFGRGFSDGERSVLPDLDEASKRCRYTAPFLVVFGDKDDRSMPADLGACRQSPLGEIAVLSGVSHSSTGARAFERVKRSLSK